MAIMTAPLATFEAAQAFGAGEEILRSFSSPSNQAHLMTTASMAIESRCDRRLAPFNGLVETRRAVGVDDGFLAGQSIPLDLPGAVGRDRAMSYSATRMVRDFWVSQTAPVNQDLWSYTLQSISLLRPFNDVQIVDVGLCQGPDVDTGHVRFNLGLFCPEGTTIVTTYGGGYNPIPYDLQMATIFQAIKFALVGASPEARKDMTTLELDAEILSLIAPYIRS